MSGADLAADADGGPRTRVVCGAWLATMAAGAALLPLVDERAWLAEAGVLLAAQSAVGVVTRWRGLPAAVTVAVQAVVSLLLLTLVTVPGQAVAGVIPGPAAFDRLGALLEAGADDIGRYVAPAPVTDGIRLMLLGGVLLIGLLVDLLAATLRSAAAAGLPLLALYSVAAGVNQTESAWPYFLCAAAGYLLLLLAESRERLARWGRYFPGPGYAPGTGGGPPRPAPGPRVRAGRRIGAVTLAVAAAAPLLLPALGDGLLGLDDRDTAGGLGGSTAVDPVVALQDQLNQPTDRTVLTYRTDAPEGTDLYLRLVALDEFDGAEWRSSSWHEEAPPAPPWPVPGLTTAPFRTATTYIEAEQGYAQNSLPVPYPAVGITAAGDWLRGWRYDRGSQTMASQDRRTTVSGHAYQVEHYLVEPTADQLARAPEPAPEFQEYYTRVPDDLPAEVRQAALTVTEGADDDYERGVALQDWFTREGGFRYDTSVASGTGSDAMVNFLNDREGFCVHFAFTMAAMARTLDIPAQVAVGFSPGERRADRWYEVGIHNAHAWPELYFEGIGWVRFEPTPGQGSTPSYTLPDPRDPVENPSPGAEETLRPEPEPSSPEPSSTPSPTPSTGCDPTLEPGACGNDTEQPTPESDADDAGLPLGWPAVLGGGGALLLAGLVATPPLWRRGVRSRRLAGGPGGASALGAWRELTDSAWDFGVAPVASETPRQAARRIVRVTGMAGEAAAAVHRVADAVEHELYAPAPAAGRRGGGLAGDVAAARAGLSAAAGRPARLRAFFLPRSAMRVVNALTERRVAGAQRLAARLRGLVPRRRGA